ncbi:ATP-binding protein [[Clostridium] innocuum]|jgi:AAA15 family ATPase/GTPase|nr:ATP-binding protein [[Clostridium] innocuum]MCR0534700.1 ATP-binding protein [[Clostridium] innocuum]MCR0538822.1 ATP-binding protein [[Clostridium] innocuum]MDU1119277.1 ATP-binding protein [Erysipelotrichaceae bacterium]
MISNKKERDIRMLARFEVENFKNFKDRLILDLEKKNNYEFNTELVKYDVIRAGVIFGDNAAGKSNLGLAIFDLISHLTDKEKGISKYKNYLNLDSEKEYAEFTYIFKFDKTYVKYEYKKRDSKTLIEERLEIDNQEMIGYNYETHDAFCQLEGTENLNTNLENSDISFIKYINANTVLIDTPSNTAFKKFISFVNSMLLFYSLQDNHYQGFKTGTEGIAEGIINRGKLADFELFLNAVGIKCKLIEKEIDDSVNIYNVFKNAEVNFFSTASTGTKSLALFYFWLIQMEEMSLVFIDEFDAYYHYTLAAEVVKYVTEHMHLQVLFTSHNTNLMSNDLLRPDCYFNLKKGSIKSFASLTDKELRKAHNLQKMYKAGAFDE